MPQSSLSQCGLCHQGSPNRISLDHLELVSVFYLYHPIGRDRALLIVMPTEKLMCTPSACFLCSPFCAAIEASSSCVPGQSRKSKLTQDSGGARTR